MLDDHTRRPDFYLRSDAYLRWQLGWLRRLDRVAGAEGTVLACPHLLATPLDSVVVAARMLSGAVDAIEPDLVRYVGRSGPVEENPYHRGHLQFWPLLGDLPLAGRLLPLIAAHRGLPFEPLDCAEGQAAPDTSALNLFGRARRHLSRTLGPYRRASIGGLARGSGTLMLWYSGYGADCFEADERRSGRRPVYITRGEQSVRLVDPALLPVHRSGKRISLQLSRSVAPLPSEVSELLDEIDEWTGVPGAARALEARLAIFLDVVCPAVSRSAEALEAQLESFDIQRVAAANPSSIEEFASLVAAGRRGIPRTLVQHGDHLFTYGFWLLTETQNFEVLASTDPTVAADLATTATEIGARAPRVTGYAPRIHSLLKAVKSRSQRADREDAVIYVPCPFSGDSNWIGAAYFDDAWYHRWHLRLLDFMAANPGTRFIWKALPSSDQAVDPIPDVIVERLLTNIRYERRHFHNVVRTGDRVILDFPSTTLYEAAHLGLATVAVSFSRFAHLRPDAAEIFASVLRVCDTEDQAIGHIQAFVAGERSNWLVDPQRLAVGVPS